MLRKQQVAQQQLERQLIAQLGTSSNGPIHLPGFWVTLLPCP
jgi:hypothetical protein